MKKDGAIHFIALKKTFFFFLRFGRRGGVLKITAIPPWIKRLWQNPPPSPVPFRFDKRMSTYPYGKYWAWINVRRLTLKIGKKTSRWHLIKWYINRWFETDCPCGRIKWFPLRVLRSTFFPCSQNRRTTSPRKARRERQSGTGISKRGNSYGLPPNLLHARWWPPLVGGGHRVSWGRTVQMSEFDLPWLSCLIDKCMISYSSSQKSDPCSLKRSVHSTPMMSLASTFRALNCFYGGWIKCTDHTSS